MAHVPPGARNEVPAMIWALVALGAFLLNVVPAFMPPTWALLAWSHVQFGLPTLQLALVGTLASTAGRVVLALGSRAFGDRFIPRKWEENLRALERELEDHPGFGVPFLVLFLLGPAPSNHVFIAAGMSNAPLLPLAALFAVSRFISYVVWIEASAAVTKSLADILSPVAGGWTAALVQIGGILVLIGLMQVDWARLFRRLDGRRQSGGGAEAVPVEGDRVGRE